MVFHHPIAGRGGHILHHRSPQGGEAARVTFQMAPFEPVETRLARCPSRAGADTRKPWPSSWGRRVGPRLLNFKESSCLAPYALHSPRNTSQAGIWVAPGPTMPP